MRRNISRTTFSKGKGDNGLKKHLVRIVSLLICAVTLISALSGCSTSKAVIGRAALVQAVYPAMVQRPKDENASFSKWLESRRAQTAYIEDEADIGDFIKKTVGTFLGDTDDSENRVYSPLNVFMALAMLAEVTGGNTRTQILDLLGFEDIAALRAAANALWNANYYDDGSVTSILANSLWMRDDTEYKIETLKVLAEEYFASSFRGVMGSDEYNEALRAWLDEQTGGLLKDHIKDITMDPLTVLAIASTIYFKASWDDEFSESANTDDLFHAPSGDKTVTYMNRTMGGYYYYGEKFSSVALALRDSGSMFIILPDEGVGANDLMNDEETLSFIASNNGRNKRKSALIDMSIPKFDVDSKLDLVDKLKSLGVTDCFNAAASDFTPLTDQFDSMYVDSIEHSARVKIDEEGIEAAAYTVIMAENGAMMPEDEVVFKVDRPFIFVLTGIDGLPLFTGIVNQP